MSSIKHHVTGIEYWRSLEQLADSPEIREMVSKEFPGYDPDTIATRSRRGFLKLMGASMALAGLTLTGCRRAPEQKLAPYSANLRDRLPGVPEQYASVWEIGGVGTGVLVTSYDGRPIKIEGNPSHPFSVTVPGKIGSADAFAQASVLEMYDPHRSRSVVDRSSGKAISATWDDFIVAAQSNFAAMKGGGEKLAILSESTSSPSVADMKKRLLALYPKAKWVEYEPLSRDAELEGSRLAFGAPVRPQLHLDKAQTVVCLDADPLGAHPAHVRYAADWVSRRRSADNASDPQMSRVYVAECGFSITGSVADERLGVTPDRIDSIARAMAQKLGVAGIPAGENLSDLEAKFVDLAVADLKTAGKAGLLAVGYAASPAVHAMAFAINEQLGAVGETITLLEDPAGDRPSHMQAIADLTKQMAGGGIATLLIFGGNPVYDAPVDLDFAKALAAVPLSVHLSLHEDETSHACKWHLPRAHYLENWGDSRAWDGTASIVQPLIEPLFGGKSAIEVLALVTGDLVTTGEQIIRRTWKDLLKADEFERDYRRVLEAGVLPNSAFPAAKVELKKDVAWPAAPSKPQGLTLRFEPDSRVYDGRFANNGWLQETPDPLTKMTWDNAALVAKVDADRLGVETNDMLRLTVEGRSLDVAVYVMPGQPIGVIGLSLGYGRTHAGPIGDGLGFNSYVLRTSKAPYDVPVAASKSGGSYRLALTQAHHIMMGSLGAGEVAKRVGPKNHSGTIIREATLAEFKRDASEVGEQERVFPLQLFEPPVQFNNPHAWGMSIDLTACIGCNACAVACQAENNIPIVGKDEVLMHREMNWIRIDRYFKGAAEDPDIEVVFQPVTCQHCENAPCEQVCPVTATVHDSEGLNTMVYNRCVGTRYCSNNCPYKVRRFNYFDFHSKDPRANWGVPFPGLPDQQQQEQVDPIKQMVFNPEVTVRMRGVMEKCTYCVQRIHGTVINKRNQGQDIIDGDIVTACQQACPTQAIIFGNLNDKNAHVTRLHQSPRSYKLLEDLNTRPRTQYLAKLRNPAEPVA